MKHNEFSEIEEITGDILKEKMMILLEDSSFACAGKMPVCLIELPDGTHAQVGIYFETDEYEMSL